MIDEVAEEQLAELRAERDRAIAAVRLLRIELHSHLPLLADEWGDCPEVRRMRTALSATAEYEER